MTRPMVRIHNTQTNEIIDREMNDDEFAQYEINKKESLDRVQAEKAAAEAKASLLTKLGITAEEANLLLK